MRQPRPQSNINFFLRDVPKVPGETSCNLESMSQHRFLDNDYGFYQYRVRPYRDFVRQHAKGKLQSKFWIKISSFPVYKGHFCSLLKTFCKCPLTIHAKELFQVTNKFGVYQYIFLNKYVSVSWMQRLFIYDRLPCNQVDMSSKRNLDLSYSLGLKI